MPQRKNDKNKQPQQKVQEMTCGSCGLPKKQSEYYVSYNPIHATGRIPYCKSCLKNMVVDDRGNIDINKVKSTLKLIDRPFLSDIWETSLEDKMDSFGCYIKNIQMPQYRKLTWDNSKDFNEFKNNNNIFNENNDIVVDSKLINFWGQNWQPDEYIRLEKFYRSMVDNNKPETPQDEDYIKKIARLSVQIDKAIESGDSKTAKSLGDLYSKYMADAKLRTSDTSDADKSGGIRRFCDIFAEVEKDDFIPPWEYYRKINGAKQDIVDKTIMFILNFMLKFNKSDKLVEPPSNTPIIEKDEIDENAKASLELKDLEDMDVVEYE
jgi:hypothetical protein